MSNKSTGKVIIGGIFFLASVLLTGCDQADDSLPPVRGNSAGNSGDNVVLPASGGVMTMVEEIAPGDYRIVKEYPSKTTGVVVKHLNGKQEVIPEENVPAVMEQARTEKGMGLGSVLSAGLLGYMMGRSSLLSPYVYKDDSLYRQSLANRNLMYRQQEQEDRRRGYTGYWQGGRYYSSARGAGQVGRSSTGAAKSGFFSSMGRSFGSFG